MRDKNEYKVEATIPPGSDEVPAILSPIYVVPLGPAPPPGLNVIVKHLRIKNIASRMTYCGLRGWDWQEGSRTRRNGTTARADCPECLAKDLRVGDKLYKEKLAQLRATDTGADERWRWSRNKGTK